MTEAETNLLEDEAAYIGPVINQSRSALKDMTPLPLCVVCPAAQWYRTEDPRSGSHLAAFCTAFRGVMYDASKRAITACDGRTDAIAGMDRRPA